MDTMKHYVWAICGLCAVTMVTVAMVGGVALSHVWDGGLLRCLLRMLVVCLLVLFGATLFSLCGLKLIERCVSQKMGEQEKKREKEETNTKQQDEERSWEMEKERRELDLKLRKEWKGFETSERIREMQATAGINASETK